MLSSSPLGYEGWDQGLKTLGESLFPDQLKIAQGYYYGTQSRKTQLESNRLIEQQAYRNSLGMDVAGMQPASPTWSYTQLPNSPPIMNSPANLPIVPAPGPGQPPLSSAIVGPSGGQVVPPTMTVPQAVNTLGAMVEKSPTALQGAPQPGSPAYERPTGSDGSVPPNDTGSAAVHPATFMPPGGGTIQAPPASNNGSPAPAMVNVQQYVGKAALAGMDAATQQNMAQAVIAEAVRTGRIASPLAHDVLGGLGAPNQSVADINAASSARTTGMVVGGEMAREKLRVGEQARQFDEATVQVQPGGPGTPPIPMKRKDAIAMGVPLYDAAVANTRQGQMGAPVVAVNPAAPSAPGTFTTVEDAQKNKLLPQATSEKDQIAVLTQQWQLEQDPVKKKAILQQILAINATPKVVTAEEYNFQQQTNYKTDQSIYAQPQTGNINIGVKDPVLFNREAQELINQRTSDLETTSTYRNKPDLAHAAAVNQLISEGLLQSPEQINQARIPARGKVTSAGFAGDPRIGTAPIPGAKTGSPSVDHMMVGLTSQGMQALGRSPAATPPGGSTTTPATTTTTPAPTTQAAPAAPVVALTPSEQFGGYTPQATSPDPNPLSRLFGAGGTLNPPAPSATPLTTSQMYGSQPQAPAVAPTSLPTPQMYGGQAPTGPSAPQPIGRAPPGTPDGPRTISGRPVNVVNGLIFAQ